MKSGFVAIIGRPNAGKSTLLNSILKKKISIISNKPQTTRDNIQGIYNEEDVQIIFIDTPGIHKPHFKLGEYMNKEALSSTSDVEATILLVDGSVPYGEGDEFVKDNIKTDSPLFIVFNKIDLTNVILIEKLKAKYQELFPQATLIEISALNKVNIDLLLKKIIEVLPDGPKYFSDDTLSDHSRPFLAKEIVREKILKLTQKEIPHSVAIVIDKFNEKENRIEVFASIVVERKTQKAILIGSQGSMIKKIREQSRFDMSKLFNKNVELELFVRVEEDWRDKARYLKEFGYSDK